MSTMQQTALCATGFIWSRYATVINPVNYNLMAVNVTLAATGTYQLYRKISYEMAGRGRGGSAAAAEAGEAEVGGAPTAVSLAP